jgi:hypothetical protein
MADVTGLGMTTLDGTAKGGVGDQAFEAPAFQVGRIVALHFRLSASYQIH